MADRTWRQSLGPGRLLVALALALALTGCGSDNPDSTDTPDADATSTAPSETPSTPDSTDSPADPSTTDTEEPAPEESESATATPPPGDPALQVSVVSGDRGLSAVVATKPGDGTDALTGKLIIAQRGCLHFTNESGPPTLLVFPPGAGLDTVRKPTLEFDGARYPVGRPLNLTGEWVQLDGTQAAAAKPCPTRSPVFRIASLS